MACCLKAPGHYLNQSWLLISEVLWHSPESNFTANAQASILHNEFEDHTFKITCHVSSGPMSLTHWGRVTHICVGDLTIIGSDNGLSPGRRQAIIWTNAGMLLIGPLQWNFLEMHTFSLKKIHFKMSSGKRRPFCRPQHSRPDTGFSSKIQFIATVMALVRRNNVISRTVTRRS